MGYLDDKWAQLKRYKEATANQPYGMLQRPIDNIKANARSFGAELQQAPDDIRNMLSPEFATRLRQKASQPANLDKDKMAAMAMDYLQTTNPIGGMVGAIKAYHGSPHKFDKFDMSKLGTGEGAQAYGHGLYFADNPAVAKSYQTTKDLSDGEMYINNKLVNAETAASKKALTAIRGQSHYAQNEDPLEGAFRYFQENRNSYRDKSANLENDKALEYVKYLKENNAKYIPNGQMYDVNLRWPDPAREAKDPLGPQHFLDWDKPLSEQAEKVPMIRKMFDDRYGATAQRNFDAFMQKNSSVSDLFNARGPASGRINADTSSSLTQQGLPGIRYLDGNSRTAGQGSSNYVVFDDQLAEIAKRNGEPVHNKLLK